MESEDGPQPLWTSAPFAVEGVLGIATPVGAIGVWADYSVTPWLAVGTGFGTNLVGIEGAAMVRVRFAGERNAFYVGAGGSIGQYMENDITKGGLLSVFTAGFSGKKSVEKRWRWAKFLNIETGFEKRRVRTLSLHRVFGGVAILLTPTPDEVTLNETEPPPGSSDVQAVLIYGGVAFGWLL